MADQVAACEGFRTLCPDLAVDAAVAIVWATTVADAAVGAPCSALERGGGLSSSTVVDSGVVWATRRLDLEVVTAFLRLAAVWDVPSINRSGDRKSTRLNSSHPV